MYNAEAMTDNNKKDIDTSEILEEEYSNGEEFELEEFEEQEADKIKKLRHSLKECEAEKAGHLEELQRTRADFLNSKRRLEEQFDRDRERIIENLVSDLLPLLDSFDTAMGDTEGFSTLDAKWRQGIEGIHGQLMSFLQSYNIEQIHPLGQPFDPHEHEAVSNVPQREKEKIDSVVTVFQKGYKRNGTIIRPAKVAVGIES